LTLLSTFTFGQPLTMTASKNFESFFRTFIKAYPANKHRYVIENYGELNELKEIPEELKMMADYDTTTFYTLYLYHIKYLRDTLIKISSLTLNKGIQDIYANFKQSVVDGERQEKFNYTKDLLYSDKLKTLLKGILPPKVGYSQTAKIVAETPDGHIVENRILIKYNNDLETISFYTLDK
jgi:hypothetical protein